MLLIVGALGAKTTRQSHQNRDVSVLEQAQTYRIGVLNSNLLLPALANVGKDPTKRGSDPFVNVSTFDPFRLRDRLFGVQVDNQIEFARELGSEQGREHRIGLISFRTQLQRRVLLRSFRQYFNLENKIGYESKPESRRRTLTMIPLISFSSPFSTLISISIRCSFRNTLSASTILASINNLRLAEA